MIDVLDIVKSWAKLFSSKKTTQEINLAAERYKICSSCEFRSRLDFCLSCGCYLKAKVFTSNAASCPKGKWNEAEIKAGLIKKTKSLI
jgi:membrane protease subunit (stomatin/prohibitin family)